MRPATRIGLAAAVLIDATMPDPEMLPRSLRALCRSEPTHLRHATFDQDLPVLIEVVEDDEHTARLLRILDEMLTGGALVTMEKVLRCPVLFLGVSLPEHGYHAPNENFDWGQASRGMAAFARYFELVAGMGVRR